MTAFRIFGGAFILALGFLCLGGCQDAADQGNYQEYSALDKESKASKLDEQPSAKSAVQVLPAIAEKRGQPAIAQASDDRMDSNQTEPVSLNVTAQKVQSRPGQVVLATSTGPAREIKLLVPEKRFAKASADGTLRVTFDDIDLLKILNMEPVPLDAINHFPDWLLDLEGKRIRIRGFMMPDAFQETGLRGFTLARDNEICCFGRDPKVYDLIVVRMKEGTTTDFMPQRPFDVVGTFHFLPPEPEDKVLFRLYEIRDAEVITGRYR